LSANEAAPLRRRRSQAENESAVRGVRGFDRETCTVRKKNSGEVNYGKVIGCEIAIEASLDPSGVIGSKLYDSAGYNGFLRQN